MPLPLPNLDDRRWKDLVDEARALIPRYAPSWTDHNVHDPGITLIELLAWQVEQEMYRANRVPERSYRAFLELLGEPPAPPAAALGVAWVEAAGGTSLPAGLVLEGKRPDGSPVLYRTLSDLTIADTPVRWLLVDDGTGISDRSDAWSAGDGVLAFGANPISAQRRVLAKGGETPDDVARRYGVSLESLMARNCLAGPAIALSQPQCLCIPAGAAFYMGFDRPLPTDQPIRLWLSLAGPGTDAAERRRIIDEAAAQRERCRTQGLRTCATDAACLTERHPLRTSGPLFHHSAVTVWEYFDRDRDAWRMLSGDEVVDDTRGLTLDGAVLLRLPDPPGQVTVGGGSGFFLRCRFDSGQHEAPPQVLDVRCDAVALEQAAPLGERMEIAASGQLVGVPPHADLDLEVLQLELDEQGKVTYLELAIANGELPKGPRVIACTPPSPPQPGWLMLEGRRVGVGNGQPLQALALSDAMVADGDLDVWTLEARLWRRWRLWSDLAGAKRTDSAVVLDAGGAKLSFGDGERGAVLPLDSQVFVRCRVTLGSAGETASGGELMPIPDPYLRGLAGARIDANALPGMRIRLRRRGGAGADPETFASAAGRATEKLAAHERLVDLAGSHGRATLDQIERASVDACVAPQRATGLLDFERLALQVPGTHVARARAWEGMDPAFPCFMAPGTVTLVVVPELPAGRPSPSEALLHALRGYLERRRVLGTRLIVCGPTYVEVGVVARIACRTDADPARVAIQVEAAINGFLDPLGGGPHGQGWPFGRDVDRAEIMRVIDDVPGVDHVLELELSADGGARSCGNLCLGTAGLTTAGSHQIEVLLL
ncbi:baseplate J/gp47 family protein [Thiococcus pfennigii]|uniref:baseplate J/gp47 family protein n=1 Tax=Thiococcus pfennigii TaxID=1057 RepID=UPI0019058E31|nr:baseplate J/gp47 family protein [Thiococcus pfennigii]MBK1699379.1 hypothetical protein [Thiococcus pfennigii]